MTPEISPATRRLVTTRATLDAIRSRWSARVRRAIALPELKSLRMFTNRAVGELDMKEATMAIEEQNAERF